MNEDSVKSGTSTSNTPPARGTREGRRYARLFAVTKLTTLFNNIADQPIPDEFVDLLRRIDARRLQA